ncbi:MAG: cation transporter [Bacteroidales bacterium]|nr:MAG: cation transporter [Bacteroidales bacterium]
MDIAEVHKSHRVSQGKMLATVALNLITTLVEFTGGILSNSLALVSDALHNLGDTFAITISYIALKASKRSSTVRKTFGFKRVEILVALFNSTVLIAVSIFLFFEAYDRLADPQPIRVNIMFWIALVGLLANLFSVFLLRKDAGHNLNIRSAYLHLLGDTLSSVAVIIGSILIRQYGLFWIDPVLTFLIGLFIIKETWSILRETIEILMEATPRELDLDFIKLEMEKHPKVANIHHIHAWRLNDTEVHFQCHADISDNMPILESDKVREELEDILIKKFDIHHVTIQVEYDSCHDKNSISTS